MIGEQLFLFFISLVANIFSALAGGGAGLIQLPAIIFMGLPFSVALATHKIASVALGIGATIRHSKSTRLDWRFAAVILGAGLPGVVLGANIILNIPPAIAELSLGILTLSLGLYSFLRGDLGQHKTPRNRSSKGLAFGALILFFIGVLNGSLTSGTGLFVTLWLVRWFGMDYKSAVAYTLILVGLFWNSFGAITLSMLGEVAWGWLPALLAGSLIGGFLGAHLAIIKGNRWIKRSFELVTVAVGIKLIIGTY